METKYVYSVSGQVRGGKNNVMVLKSGLRIPPKIFSQWAKAAIAEIKAQGLPEKPIDYPCNISIEYYCSDRRRRDAPAIIDGLFHALERAGVVKDDSLLGGENKVLLFEHKGQSKTPHANVLVWNP